jgi:hypothetical protein
MTQATGAGLKSAKSVITTESSEFGTKVRTEQEITVDGLGSGAGSDK